MSIARVSAVTARPLLVLAVMLSGIAAAAAQEPAQRMVMHRYFVSTDAQLESLAVRACFAGLPPARLYAAADAAGRYLREPRLQLAEGERPLQPGTRALSLADAPSGACVAYQVDLAGAARSGQRIARRVGRDLATEVGLWLWRPRELAPGSDIEIAFELPEGLSVSAPWVLADNDPRARTFLVGHTPWHWPALVAFGRFEVQELALAGTRLRVAVLDGSPPVDRSFASRWIGEAANAVAALYGAFPLPSPQVLVVPQAFAGEPVPWAQVMRGGGAAAHFFIDQREPLQAFRDDWTATHELSHMLLPYLARRDAWLSEGFASYYQNVLRARAGMLSPAEAWSKLDAGFRRGALQTRAVPLRASSSNMYRDREFMRVYWSGAAFALTTDVRLRELSNGRQSLDTVLAALQRCCLSTERVWSGEEFLERLDALSGTELFTTVGEDFLDAETFPELGELYQALGLGFSDGQTTLDDAAPRAAFRDAIMSAAGSYAAAAGTSATNAGSGPLAPR